MSACKIHGHSYRDPVHGLTVRYHCEVHNAPAEAPNGECTRQTVPELTHEIMAAMSAGVARKPQQETEPDSKN
jgi:hypothetical protein